MISEAKTYLHGTFSNYVNAMCIKFCNLSWIKNPPLNPMKINTCTVSS